MVKDEERLRCFIRCRTSNDNNGSFIGLLSYPSVCPSKTKRPRVLSIVLETCYCMKVTSTANKKMSFIFYEYYLSINDPKHYGLHFA